MTPTATPCVRESDLRERHDLDRPNAPAYNVASEQEPGRFLEILPDGTFGATDNIDGQYAVCYRVENDLFWDCAGPGGNFYPTGSYGMPLARGL